MRRFRLGHVSLGVHIDPDFPWLLKDTQKLKGSII